MALKSRGLKRSRDELKTISLTTMHMANKLGRVVIHNKELGLIKSFDSSVVCSFEVTCHITVD